MKKHRFLFLLLSLIILCSCFSACGSDSGTSSDSGNTDNAVPTITLSASEQDYIRIQMPLAMVIDDLESQGFTNINAAKETDMIGTDYQLVAIRIGEDSAGFSKGDSFLADSPVEIRYAGDPLQDNSIDFVDALSAHLLVSDNHSFGFENGESSERGAPGDFQWQIKATNADKTKAYLIVSTYELVFSAEYETFDNDIAYLQYCVEAYDSPDIDVQVIQDWISNHAEDAINGQNPRYDTEGAIIFMTSENSEHIKLCICAK